MDNTIHISILTRIAIIQEQVASTAYSVTHAMSPVSDGGAQITPEEVAEILMKLRKGISSMVELEHSLERGNAVAMYNTMIAHRPDCSMCKLVPTGLSQDILAKHPRFKVAIYSIKELMLHLDNKIAETYHKDTYLDGMAGIRGALTAIADELAHFEPLQVLSKAIETLRDSFDSVKRIEDWLCDFERFFDEAFLVRTKPLNVGIAMGSTLGAVQLPEDQEGEMEFF